MSKPIIIAICGKAAAGKSTLARKLVPYLQKKIDKTWTVHLIKGCTTRPPREKEIDGIDYWFLSERKFKYLIRHDEFIEYNKFRDWYYGTLKDELIYDNNNSNIINIGIFNPTGINELVKYQSWYKIIPIYLDIDWDVRFERLIKRYKGWNWEILRRAWTDFWDFIKIKTTIYNKFRSHLYYNNNFYREQNPPVDIVAEDILGKIW